MGIPSGRPSRKQRRTIVKYSVAFAKGTSMVKINARAVRDESFLYIRPSEAHVLVFNQPYGTNGKYTGWVDENGRPDGLGSMRRITSNDDLYTEGADDG
jgi:hypothetical protein